LNNDIAGMSGHSARVPLSCVVVNDELSSRPARVPDLASETRVLLRLADTMARAPDRILQELVENLCELCRAGSTGISILDPPDEAHEARFRWIATAGQFKDYAGHTMPRHKSPCGAVLDANTMLLMSDPARHYPDIETLSEPVTEALLFPFHRDDRAVGTIWVVSHSPQHKFDQEDVRLVQDLERFAAAAVHACAQAQAHAILEASARAAAERQLMEMAEMNRQIREADKGKTESLATLGHELRNIIGPLAHAVAVLQKSDDPEVQRRSREIMDRQTKHLLRMIEDVLDSSRFACGKLRVETTPLDLNLVISQAVEIATERMLQSGQRIEMTLSPAPLIVEADNQRLHQVFTNLLDNAAKYGRAGCPVAITVDSQDGHARVRIRDQGIGIDQQMLPRIFDLFVQTNQSLNRSQGGLGIGLALVRHLVELHGGRVEVRSNGPGTGSEFSVCLPLRHPQALCPQCV
jgi:signal transduction histidine kinase